MSASDPGDYLVTVQGPTPDAEWSWRGYADNVSDALARAENERQDEA